MLKMLIQLGAEPTLKDKNEQTVMDFLSQNRNSRFEDVYMLLDAIKDEDVGGKHDRKSAP